MITKKHLVLIILAIGFSISGQAQLKTPAASPFCSLEQELGLSKITLKYSRPSMNGRTIFGDLVPFGEIWRFGANASTKITFEEDVKLNGNKVPKGTYALYAIPNPNKWTIIIHKNITHWGFGGDNYKQQEDLVRFEVASQELPMETETFTIMFDDIKNDGAAMWVLWEKTAVSIDIELETDSKVMASIDNILAGPSAGTYYQMANYYYSNGKDMNQALDWVNKALEGGERYWIVTLKARIHGKLGQKNEAIMASKRAIKLAETANPDYVRINQKLLKEWGE